MAAPSAYLLAAKSLPGILNAIQDAGVPPRFTNEFLKSLGFTSSNDRAVIGVLKALGFVDQSGVPNERYRRYRNKGEAPHVLAEAIRDAYADIFLAHEHAETLSADRIKGILATKTDKGESVIEKMASTFRALVGIAKWDKETKGPPEPEALDPPAVIVGAPPVEDTGQRLTTGTPAFHYNIQIHLPVTKDISVYNAIFRSLKEHLL